MGNHLDLVCATLRSTEEELRESIDLACTKLKNTEEELQNTKEQFKEITKKLHERIVALEKKCCQEPIYTWKINGIHRILEEAKTGNGNKIESDPFYTSEGGYKVSLCLYAGGSLTGENTHLSIFFRIMKGDFDSILKWPFVKRVTFTLIDQQENANDRENIIGSVRENQEQQAWNSRPLREFGCGRGIGKFVSHDVLMKRGYVQDDTILIQAKFETVAP